MNREEIKEFFKKEISEKRIGTSGLGKTIKAKYPNVLNSMIECTGYLKNVNFNERLYHILNDLFEIPFCKICNDKNKPLRYQGYNLGYSTYCSTKCMANDPEVQRKKKESYKRKTGFEFPFQNPEVQSKMKKGWQEKFGVDHISQLSEIKEKKKQASIKKYGVDCPLQHEEIKDKAKKTIQERYGVDNYTKTEEYKIKTKDTCMKKYGVDHCMKDPMIRKKAQDTCMKKYNTNHPFQSDIIKDKVKNIFLEKYGVTSPMHLAEIKEKIKNTCMEKYGETTPMRVPEFKDKLFVKLKKNWINDFKNYLKNFKEISLVEYRFNTQQKYKLKCERCGNIFDCSYDFIRFRFINKKELCPICYPLENNGTSIGEKQVLDFIKEILPNEEIISNDRTIIKPKELDIYIPSKNVAIEFDGIYWHSEKFMNPKYHLEKTHECLDKGIQLIHIFEDEWIFKEDIVKARLKQILGFNNSIRIHARKCKIKEISPKEKNEFLEKFHIQGKDNSVIKLGAFYNNELISLMTFSHGSIAKGSKSKKDIWELNRFCSNSNYHIPGIAGKLLKYFQRNYEWKEIFSYADRRWSSGNLYHVLNFNLEHITKPNYWYIRDFQRIHRFNLRKRSDEPKDIPEWKLRFEEGYLRVWDCGNLKFLMKNIIQ